MVRPLTAFWLLLVAAMGSAAQAQVELKHKAVANTKETREVAATVSQTLTIAGMELKTAADSAYTISATAGAPDGDGNIPITMKFESVRSNLALPGNMNVNYDSSINLAKADNPLVEFLLDALKAMHQASYVQVVTPANEFVRIEGTDKLFESAGPQAAAFLKGQFNEEKTKREHEQMLARFPNKPIKPGDTWQQIEEVDFGSGQIMKVERHYEYVGTQERDGRTLDKILAPDKKVISFDAEPNAQQPFKIGGADLKVVESQATILFDRQRGADVETSRLMHIRGKLTLTLGGMELPTDLDLKMEMTDRLKP